MNWLRSVYRFVWPNPWDRYPSGKSMILGAAIVAAIVTLLAWLDR